MARRRMFSLDIVDTDKFLDMPISTQALFFHLGMRSDDEGFVGNPKKIAKSIGASDMDLKLLCQLGYLIPFESGIIVITHWKMQNSIGKDRYHPTIYRDEKNLLLQNVNKAYELKEKYTKENSPKLY